jgi:hypothetical protein
MRYIHGIIPISDQLLQRTIIDEEAIIRHEDRLMHDPEYAAKWVKSVDWDAWDVD